MKRISIVVPCYNEEENVEALADALKSMFKKNLENYQYEIIFIDNDSKDKTRDIIRKMCAEDKGIKGIFNAKNFGQFNSPYYAMLQSTGDCTVLMAADFQDPVDMVPGFVKEWESGYKIVIGIKKSSQENKIMYWLRGWELLQNWDFTERKFLMSSHCAGPAKPAITFISFMTPLC